MANQTKVVNALTATDTIDASLSDMIFEITDDNYNQLISGFSAGDVLKFSDIELVSASALLNDSFTDNKVTLQSVFNKKLAAVTLTGISQGDDIALTAGGVSAFNNVFGAGAVINNVVTPNTAPTAITLDNLTIKENATDFHIGNVSGTDPEGDDLTFSIGGGSDASAFEIINKMLHLKGGVSNDFETKNQLKVVLTARDTSGLSFDSDFIVSVINVEEAPNTIELDNLTIKENATDFHIGNVSGTDPEGDELIFSISGGDDASLFEIVDNKLQLKSGTVLDFETKNQLKVALTATDTGGLLFEKNFIVSVINVEEQTVSNLAPTAIELDNLAIVENTSENHIANITGSDPEGDDLTFTISGGADESDFEIIDNNMLHLKAGVSIDYETQNQVQVALTATDTSDLPFEKEFTLSVTDVDEPLLTHYGMPDNDKLVGFEGYDIINGMGGIDQVTYSKGIEDVSFSLNSDNQLVVNGLVSGQNKTETLISIERLQFSDKNYALDIDGNAGIAAKVIIATFGAESISKNMSPALSVIDGGKTLADVCALVIDLQLIKEVTGSSSNGSFVDHVYKNVVGVAPSTEEHDSFTALLDDGTYTQSALLELAANTTLTEALVNANLVGLIGVSGVNDGQLLSIQYEVVT
ncbi:MAG: cadherin repeat domain-containing protein [Deltaproteobacteria bacterium]|nr:cadherin repeat domain-containing protein [Deltaproteobacteria bacterium]